MPKGRVCFIRFKRLLSAAAGSVAPLLGIGVTLLGLFFSAKHGAKLPPALTYSALAFIAVLVVVWFVQSWFAFVRTTHDPTWIMKLQDVWNSPQRIYSATRPLPQYGSMRAIGGC